MSQITQEYEKETIKLLMKYRKKLIDNISESCSSLNIRTVLLDITNKSVTFLDQSNNSAVFTKEGYPSKTNILEMRNFDLQDYDFMNNFSKDFFRNFKTYQSFFQNETSISCPAKTQMALKL